MSRKGLAPIIVVIIIGAILIAGGAYFYFHRLGEKKIAQNGASISTESMLAPIFAQITTTTLATADLNTISPYKETYAPVPFKNYDDQSEPMNSVQDYYQYQGTKFEINFVPGGEGQYGQVSYSDTLSILSTSTGQYVPLTTFGTIDSSIDGVYVHGKDIIFKSSSNWRLGAGSTDYNQQVFIYNPVLNAQQSKSISYEDDNIDATFSGKSTQVFPSLSLFLQNGNLYLKITNQHIIPSAALSAIKDQKSALGFDSYYLLENGMISDASSTFISTYLQDAQQDDSILNQADWATITKYGIDPNNATYVEKGAQILMADGTYKNIESIQPGDKVLSYDYLHKATSSQAVLNVFQKSIPMTVINGALGISAPDTALYFAALPHTLKVGRSVAVASGTATVNTLQTTSGTFEGYYLELNNILGYDVGPGGISTFYADGYLVLSQQPVPQFSDWLTPLLYRTGNLVFGGQTSIARMTLDDDLSKFSELYPLTTSSLSDMTGKDMQAFITENETYDIPAKDKRYPAIEVPSLPATTTLGSTTTVNFSFKSELPIVATSATMNGEPIDAGQTITFNTLGTTTVMISATNNASNTSIFSGQVYVAPQVTLLNLPIESSTLMAHFTEIDTLFSQYANVSSSGLTVVPVYQVPPWKSEQNGVYTGVADNGPGRYDFMQYNVGDLEFLIHNGLSILYNGATIAISNNGVFGGDGFDPSKAVTTFEYQGKEYFSLATNDCEVGGCFSDINLYALDKSGVLSGGNIYETNSSPNGPAGANEIEGAVTEGGKLYIIAGPGPAYAVFVLNSNGELQTLAAKSYPGILSFPANVVSISTSTVPLDIQSIASNTGGDGACLAAGTKVLMADGSYENIEDVKIGDAIASFDGKTKAQIIAAVSNIIQRKDSIVIINGVLHAAPDEPIYLSNGETKLAINIKSGDKIIGEDSETILVTSVTNSDEIVKTYDLTLNGAAAFFADGYLVGAFNPASSER